MTTMYIYNVAAKDEQGRTQYFEYIGRSIKVALLNLDVAVSSDDFVMVSIVRTKIKTPQNGGEEG